MHKFYRQGGEKKGISPHLFTSQRITPSLCPKPTHSPPKPLCPPHVERVLTPLNHPILYITRLKVLGLMLSPKALLQQTPKPFLKENPRRIGCLLEKVKSYPACGGEGLKGFWVFSSVIAKRGKRDKKGGKCRINEGLIYIAGWIKGINTPSQACHSGSRSSMYALLLHHLGTSPLPS